MQGYKTLSQNMLFRPGQTYKISAVLQPLAPGDPPDPRPVAAPRPQRQYGGPPPGYQPPPGEGGPPPGYQPPQGEGAPPPEAYQPPRPGQTQPTPGREGEGRQQGSTFGTVMIRVQPSDAVVVIDGERWDSPEGGSRLQVQLSAGPHRVEISKDGFRTYSTSVNVREGETVTLNVSLSTGGGGLTGAVLSK